MQFIFIHNKFKLLTADVIKSKVNTLIFAWLQKIVFNKTYFINTIQTFVYFMKKRETA